jgi:hypothetical protein
MIATPNRFYIFLSLFFITGILWLLINHTGAKPLYAETGICWVKNMYGIPCPSCGITRSVTAMLAGSFGEALYLNPFGFLVFIMMLTVPGWILFDVISAKKTLFLVFIRAERVVRKKPIAIALALLVLLNWIWNMIKYR